MIHNFNKKTIKEWELETGIEIKNPRGFKGAKNKVINKLYSRKEFLRNAKVSEIRCKTNKGLKCLIGA